MHHGTPTWLVVGNRESIGRTTGLVDDARFWLDTGGFDLTFTAPKSVSLLRAFGDSLAEKALISAHLNAIRAALAYLKTHAGYIHEIGQRLAALVALAYQHETSPHGDPHLHTHVILPNRQPHPDGRPAGIDPTSVYHQGAAAGAIYQATLRHELHIERGFEWEATEVAGVTRQCIGAWSQRSTRLHDWATNQTGHRSLPAQPDPPPLWHELKRRWLADPRGLHLDHDAHIAARTRRRATPHRGAIAAMAGHIEKPAFARAEMVEIIGAHLPVDAPGEPLALIERIVDAVSLRVSAPRAAHQHEECERFTTAAILAEEEYVLRMVDSADPRTRLVVRPRDVGDLSPDQERAIRNIAVSPFLVQPLQAPAGAGKTHSLKVLRAAAHRARKRVLVLAPTGKAVDEAMREGAGDDGLTVAKALAAIGDGRLAIGRDTVVIVDEASMLGTPELNTLLGCAYLSRAKMVLVGDAYQLAPVKARGGMFEQLCAELPWSQCLGEVWRMTDPQERQTSLALRSARGDALDTAVRWYRDRGRLHAGDPVTMAADALHAYLKERAAGRDTILICDTWEVADALNRRVHDTLTIPGPAVKAARGQWIRVGDIVMSRRNDITIELHPARGADRVDQVRNGNRWRVTAVDPDTHRLAAVRLTDKARVVFAADYLGEHVTLGYAATVHSAQGVTADSSYAILGAGASRAMAYVAMTRGRHDNQAFLYQKPRRDTDDLRRGTGRTAEERFHRILRKDGRPRTAHAVAEGTERGLLPQVVREAIQRNEARRHARMAWWRDHVRTA